MAKDYVAANLEAPVLDHLFPNMIEADKGASTWPYFRKQIDHPFRVDRRNPTVGFINRDEASILYGNARALQGAERDRDRRVARLVDRLSHRRGDYAAHRHRASPRGQRLAERVRTRGPRRRRRLHDKTRSGKEPRGGCPPGRSGRRDGRSHSSTATTTGKLRRGMRSLARATSKQPQWWSFMTWCRPTWRRACAPWRGKGGA